MAISEALSNCFVGMPFFWAHCKGVKSHRATLTCPLLLVDLFCPGVNPMQGVDEGARL